MYPEGLCREGTWPVCTARLSQADLLQALWSKRGTHTYEGTGLFPGLITAFDMHESLMMINATVNAALRKNILWNTTLGMSLLFL